MQSSQNSPMPSIEARVSKDLVEQFEAWSEAFIRQYDYKPQMTAEDALKTAATAHGIRRMVQQLRSIHILQEAKNKQPTGATNGIGKHRSPSWGPAGTKPARGNNRGTERFPRRTS